ncbi:maternal effect embryo arrest protein [Perilla frutescens var. hirtella]|uniref:Maternal effect embryo arrest protein n=1 Tax=Perilla frutescens var. hirtella TaxID=608512 RepID=A0AAD4JNK1_PERFH|nr:maternal effect embryo arrest protein [Perilla frutescens var. hirtella]
MMNTEVPMDSTPIERLDNLQQETSMDKVNQEKTTAAVAPLKTSIHVTALDGIVNVNSLFTMAIFIGISLTAPETATAVGREECTTSRETVRRLIVFEVVSFSFFLFSSLIAQSLKLAINLLNNMDPNDPHKADIDPDYLRYGLFGSAIGSVMGCLFLMLSIVDFIRVKLGDYSCGGEPIFALLTLLLLAGSGLLVYVTTAVYASFFVEISTKIHIAEQNQNQN